MATVYEQRQYTESDAAKKWREQMQTQMAAKPADYQSQYRPQIDKTIDSIVNRKDFQYDVNGDALWHQFKDRYVNLGQQAMMDTMGQAAQLTGGYGNSYAQMAGQQAYQGYLQGLTDKIPELANMAFDRYNQQGQDLYQKYGLLSGEDQLARDQWLAGYNQWLTERDWLANQYNTERGFDYGTHRDSVADDQWKAQFDEDVRRFDFANKLGEFAPVASSGGGFGGYYYGGNGGDGGNGNKNYKIVADNLADYVKGSTYGQAIKGGVDSNGTPDGGAMAQIRAAVSDGLINTNQAQQLVRDYISTKR